MRVVILTNDDLTGSLVFSSVFDVSGIDIPAVFFAGSPVKKRGNMFSAALTLMRKMDLRYWLFLSVTNASFLLFDRLTRFLHLTPKFGDLRSLRREARLRGSTVATISVFNSSEFKQRLRQTAPDLLLIRVSTILDAELLAIPKLGTWCVHSSLLPAYGGIAGEFHALREGRETIGSSVFEVTPRLDEGPVLAQVWFAPSAGRSLFAHVVANNRKAAALLAEMLEAKANRTGERSTRFPGAIEKSYFSWPHTSDVTAFGAHGRKLISLREVVALGLAACRIRRPSVSV